MIENLGIAPQWKIAQAGDISQLEADQLHLWWIPLRLHRSQQVIAQGLLNDIQRDKYARRTTPELQQAYLAGRYYLLQLLSGYIDSKADQIKFSYSRLNKPSLTHHEKTIEFNFTDTTINGVTHGLFAFTKGHQVGVDLEARTRRSNFKGIVEKRFTKNEKAFVTQANTGEIDPERFLAIWTRKEAFGKASGVGINFKMNERDLASESPDFAFFDADKRAWRLLQLELGSELIASVVHARHRPLSLQAYRLPQDTTAR